MAHQASLCSVVLVLVAFYAAVGRTAQGCENDRPLIGVISQPGEPAPKGFSYIAASYIKFVEAGGARAVPIPYDLPLAELKRRFRALNGVVIPGGSQVLKPGHKFYDTAGVLLDWAMEAQDQGTHWPVWGTCLGFETLAVLLSKNVSVLGKFDAEDLPSPLIYTPLASSSRMLSHLPLHVADALQQLPVAMENHMSGLGDEQLADNPALADFINVLAYSEDRKGRLYVSSFEAKHYPVYAVQWHPEKNAFEWAPQLHIPHTQQAVEVTQAMASFLVSEARRNCHGPEDDRQLDSLLIYNYPPNFTGEVRHRGEETDFDQCYFFPEHGFAQGPQYGVMQQ